MGHSFRSTLVVLIASIPFDQRGHRPHLQQGSAAARRIYKSAPVGAYLQL